jgi:hypothetical protein
MAPQIHSASSELVSQIFPDTLSSFDVFVFFVFPVFLFQLYLLHFSFFTFVEPGAPAPELSARVCGDSPESTRQTTAAVILGTVPDQEQFCALFGERAGGDSGDTNRIDHVPDPPSRCSCRLCAKRSPCAGLGMPWLPLFGKLRGDFATVFRQTVKVRPEPQTPELS